MRRRVSCAHFLDVSKGGGAGGSACQFREHLRRLPHFHPHAAFVFVTWRLWGSLPAQREPPLAHPSPGHAFVATDRALDRHSSGAQWLKQPPIANLVAEARSEERRVGKSVDIGGASESSRK